MAEVLKKFGRYFLLDHLAQGGMAEIYRARLAAHDGAGRLIVIKRIQAGFGANSEFLQMFKSEIKVTMGFNHPNIVQLYDFGEETEQPYIAMELVDGKNLKQFVSRAVELKQAFPIELAVYIIEQAASGLHYAHSFKDKITGEPLNIVHRDISPQNILISYEGNVKVIDFGIAKATTNLEATRAGVIKGKPSYLSPEQISGEVLDGRSDIFALGAVLWESLTGKKLFAGDTDLAVLKQIESAQTHVKPPSTLNPKVPKELDYLVLKTLAKQREKRFQNAEELQRALHKFLYSNFSEFNPSDLAYYAKELFKNEIVEDRKIIQKLNDKAEHLLASAAVEPQPSSSSESSGGAKTEKREDEITLVDAAKRTSAGRFAFNAPVEGDAIELDTGPAVSRPGPTSPGVKPAPKTHQTPTPSGASRATTTASLKGTAPQQRKVPASTESSQGMTKYIVIGAVLLGALSIFGPDFGVRVPILSDILGDIVGGGEARVILKGSQKNVTVAVNGQTVASALPATLQGIPVGTPFRVTVTGPQGSFQQEITLRKGEKKSLAVVLTQSETPAAVVNAPLVEGDKGIQLRLNIIPSGGNAAILLNNRPVDPGNPVIRVPLDESLDLAVERPGYKPFRRQFVLEARQIGGLKEWTQDVALEPAHFGFLTIRTTPSADASIMIEGGLWKQKTPVENEKIPVGTYNVRLTNDVLGMEKNVSVTIEEGKSVSIDQRLEIKN